MTHSRRFSVLVLLCFSSGCAYVQRAADVDPADPTATVLVSTVVLYEASGMPDVIAGAWLNDELPKFGEAVNDTLSPFLLKHGFAVEADKERAKRVDALPLTGRSNILGVLPGTGLWTDPRGSVYELYYLDSDRLAQVADTLGREREREAFLSIGIRIFSMSYLDGGLQVQKLELCLLVITEGGRKLFEARAEGEGPTTPFVVSRAREALLPSLRDAIRILEELEVEPLE